MLSTAWSFISLSSDLLYAIFSEVRIRRVHTGICFSRLFSRSFWGMELYIHGRPWSLISEFIVLVLLVWTNISRSSKQVMCSLKWKIELDMLILLCCVAMDTAWNYRYLSAGEDLDVRSWQLTLRRIKLSLWKCWENLFCGDNLIKERPPSFLIPRGPFEKERMPY